MYRFFFLISVLTFAFFAVTGQTARTKNVAIFSVDKNEVSTEEFVYLYKKNYQNKKEEFTREKIEQYLDLFIKFKLKVQEAKARGLDTTAAFRKEFNSYRDELRKPYLPDSKIVDSLVKLTYERMKEEINASHILVSVKPDATAEEEMYALKKITDIRNRALSGEEFVSLVEKYSDDPSSKVNKGNLGYFTAMQMVYPFENAAYQSNKGEVTEPVRTRFGYHILKINDRRPSTGELEVSHILLRTGEERDNTEAKNKIFEIYDQLQKGVAWDGLCKQYSEDPGTKESGGRLRPFGVGVMASVPEFERVAFELEKPGDYSDPFQTQFGWHIVKLERQIPLQPFESIEASLKSRVSRDERVQVSRQAIYDKLKSRHGYSENEEVRNKLIALADTTLNLGKWNPEYAAAGRDVIFRLSGKDYYAAQFLSYVKINQKRNNQPPEKYLGQLLNNFAETSLLEVVEADIARKVPEFKWILQEYYEGILLFDIMEREVWSKASADSLGQKAFFSRNPGKYPAGERIRANLYSSTTRPHIDAIADALAAKDTSRLNDALRKYKVRNESGLFEKEDRIVFSKIPWKTGVHRAENNNLYYVADVIEVVPPGLKTFEEARPDVISDYQNTLEQTWIATLRKKYPVKVSKKGKEIAIQELLRINSN